MREDDRELSRRRLCGSFPFWKKSKAGSQKGAGKGALAPTLTTTSTTSRAISNRFLRRIIRITNSMFLQGAMTYLSNANWARDPSTWPVCGKHVVRLGAGWAYGERFCFHLFLFVFCPLAFRVRGLTFPFF